MKDGRCTCPKCGEQFPVDVLAVVPDERKITIKVTLKDGFIGAGTFGELVLNLSKSLKLTAKELGQRVEVYISDSRFAGNEIEVDFIVVKVRAKP